MASISVCDFYLAVSVSDFVTLFGDKNKNFAGNETLQTALIALGVTVDLRALYSTYFRQTAIGTGDVYVYQPTQNSKNVFAIDMYRYLTDQVHIVSFAVGCDEHCSSFVRDKLRSFFDGASYQVHYEEANCSVGLREMIDEKRYPIIIEESGYEQHIHHAYG